MKKIILTVFVIITFHACNNSSVNILSKGETFLKENLDDPSSYEKISSDIIDTIRLDKYYKNLMYRHYDMHDIIDYEMAIDRVEYNKNELDSLVKNNKHKFTIKDFKESVVKKNKNSLDSILSSSDSVSYIVSKEMLEKKAKELPAIESLFSKINELKINPSKNKIQYIEIQYNFREKNKMGALIKQTIVLEYNPEGWTDNKNKYFFRNKNIHESEVVNHIENYRSKISIEQFYQIKEGMNYKEVTSILNDNGEVISSNELAGIKTVMVQWKNGNSSNMNAIFQNGRLVTKAQFGLK